MLVGKRRCHLLLHCRSYVHFCACGKKLDHRFAALGAQRLAERVDVHKEDLPAVDKWLAGVTAALPSLQLETFAQLGGNLLYFADLHQCFVLQFMNTSRQPIL